MMSSKFKFLLLYKMLSQQNLYCHNKHNVVTVQHRIKRIILLISNCLLSYNDPVFFYHRSSLSIIIEIVKSNLSGFAEDDTI